MPVNKVYIVEAFFDNYECSSSHVHSVHLDIEEATKFADDLNLEYEAKKNKLCPIDLKLDENLRPIDANGERDFEILDSLIEEEANKYYHWYHELCFANDYKGAYVRECPIGQIIEPN